MDPPKSPTSNAMSQTEQSTLDSIRNRIQEVIRPWRSAIEEPPFTPKELLVMALIMADRPLPAKAILGWVLMNFQFFSISASRLA
jgi:hypothetical protein